MKERDNVHAKEPSRLHRRTHAFARRLRATPAERGVSGGALGAAGGAAIGSLSGNAGAGAVIGGVAGAATGLLTTPPPQPQAYDGYYDRNGIYRGTRCVRWAPSGACIESRNF